MGSGGLHRAVGDGLSFGAEIGRFGALRITRPGSYMAGLRKKLTFSHQQAIKWQSLEEKEIFAFRHFQPKTGRAVISAVFNGRAKKATGTSFFQNFFLLSSSYLM